MLLSFDLIIFLDVMVLLIRKSCFLKNSLLTLNPLNDANVSFVTPVEDVLFGAI